MMLKILLLGLLMTTGHAKYTNKLMGEDSPYLLQHAHNPVDWYPWGDEAFAKAKKENKLIFLSVGYSTCHWCHVMEKESFENEEVAKILNKDFISIKVDREEYPHIDRHYQDIYMLMNRRGGGWPLTIVMTPEKKVFFSATYLPPENNHGRSGLKGLLGVLHDAYVNRHDEVQKSADSIEAAMARADTMHQNHKQFLDIGIAEAFVKSLSSVFDETYKGFGNAPKFPQATTLDTLLDIYRITKEKTALGMATQTLEAMSMGGIYDQIEGGFYRYSVDEEWLIPHFEKMLYTNAELLEAYANAYALSKNPRFKTVIMETMENIDARFKKEQMYYSASDADSDGEEGKYFVFDFSESLADLKNGGLSDAEAKEILRYYGIERQGNFEHNHTNPFLETLNAPKALEKGKAILRANREKKNYAFIDHKIQTSWNALYLKGLFAVSKHVDHAYAKVALTSLDSLLVHLYKDGELYHQMVIGKEPKVRGYLEDYAFLIAALIEAYGVGFEEKYLDTAKKLTKNAIAKFYKEGAWYMSDDGFKAKAEFYDASYRSALAVMIENLLKLAALNDDLAMHALAMDSLNAHLAALKAAPNQYPTGLKSYLQSLLSFVVIKSTKENLIQNKAALERSRYPFLLLKPSQDTAFLACKIDACFASEKSLDALLKKIEE